VDGRARYPVFLFDLAAADRLLATETLNVASSKDRAKFLGLLRDTRPELDTLVEVPALLERLAYEVVTELGAPVVGPIRTVGGAAHSDLWLRIRASACNRPFIVPVVADAAMGAAVLAATGHLHPDLRSATQAMVRSGNEVTPDLAWVPVYEERYARFKDELRARGYLSRNDQHIL